MHPIVVIVPLAVVLSGVAVFLLVPLPFGVRLAMLIGDIVAAAIVGYVLWRRYTH